MHFSIFHQFLNCLLLAFFEGTAASFWRTLAIHALCGVPIKEYNWVGPCGVLVNYNDISSQLKKYSEETYFTNIPSSISMHGHSQKNHPSETQAWQINFFQFRAPIPVTKVIRPQQRHRFFSKAETSTVQRCFLAFACFYYIFEQSVCMDDWQPPPDEPTACFQQNEVP